jgi:hypothetical protein
MLPVMTEPISVARDARALERFASGFDPEVSGRDVAQSTAVIDHGRAHALVHPHIGKRVEKSFGAHGFLSML